MDIVSGRVKRELCRRVFNSKNKYCCQTGGNRLGCPFFKMNKRKERICTLYRSALVFAGGRYKRLDNCLRDVEPPEKQEYLVSFVSTQERSEGEVTNERLKCKIIATSEEEARMVLEKQYGSCSVVKITKLQNIDYEYMS